MYPSEQHLVDAFLDSLRSAQPPWEISAFTTEFDYSSGRTDVVATDRQGTVLAFEAKLKSWRAALTQAYRNKCFAHRSYVLLPEKIAYRALKYTPEFRRRGVGICVMDGDQLVELLQCEEASPCLDWLSEKALTAVLENSETEPRNARPCPA